MTGRQPSVTSQEVEHLVHRLAAAHHLGVIAVSWVPGRGGSVARGAAGWHVRLGLDLLDSRAAARFVAVHELGHVVLGHVARRAAVRLAVALAGIMLATLAAGVMLGGWAAGPSGAVIGLGLAGWVGLGLVRAAWVAHTVRGEFAADRFARTNGCPLNATVVRLLTAAEPPPAVVDRLFPSHPSWDRRMRVSA